MKTKRNIIAQNKKAMRGAIMEEAKKLLRAIKNKSKKTDRQLWEEIGISEATFYNIKGGHTTPRSLLFIEKINKLAKKYGVNN